jgi:hypothetical protein
MAPWLEDFLHPGFWAMGIVGFYMLLSLAGNGVCSLLIILKKRTGSAIWKIALSALVVAMLGVGCLFVLNWRGEPMEVSGILKGTFWAWYFVFIPQFLIFLILKRKRSDEEVQKGNRTALRIALTMLLPIILSFVHWYLGIYVLHITPD